MLNVNLLLLQIGCFPLTYVPYFENEKKAYRITMLSVCLYIPRPDHLLNA
jgi:hypothetical protein